MIHNKLVSSTGMHLCRINGGFKACEVQRNQFALDLQYCGMGNIRRVSWRFRRTSFYPLFRLIFDNSALLGHFRFMLNCPECGLAEYHKFSLDSVALYVCVWSTLFRSQVQSEQVGCFSHFQLHPGPANLHDTCCSISSCPPDHWGCCRNVSPGFADLKLCSPNQLLWLSVIRRNN